MSHVQPMPVQPEQPARRGIGIRRPDGVLNDVDSVFSQPARPVIGQRGTIPNLGPTLCGG